MRYDKKTPVALTEHRRHVTVNLPCQTNLTTIIQPALRQAYCDQVEPRYLLRKIGLTAVDLHSDYTPEYVQINLFEHPVILDHHKEQQLQQATLDIRTRFGKDALLVAEDLAPHARTIERNHQIGGHHA